MWRRDATLPYNDSKIVSYIPVAGIWEEDTTHNQLQWRQIRNQALGTIFKKFICLFYDLNSFKKIIENLPAIGIR
jgi:hypothetical protein